MVSVALGLCLLAAPAAAQDKSVVAAASAFQQAQQAELVGEHARAAELFELADRIAPTPEALRSATRARLAAGQLTAAAGNAEELLRRYESDGATRELADQVLTRARPSLTRYTVHCSEPCTIVVDGLAGNIAALKVQTVYVTPGVHNLVIGFPGDLTRSLRLTGAAGEARALRATAPTLAPGSDLKVESDASDHDGMLDTTPPMRSREPTARPDPYVDAEDLDTERPASQVASTRRGLAPVYFWSVASATVVSGALALWSGLDLLKSRDRFENRATPTRAEFDRGERKDVRTTVLLGTTGALAAGSVVLGLFTDFSRPRERAHAANVQVDGHGARLVLDGRF